MLRAAVAIATGLLAGTPALAQRWAEIPEYPVADGAMMFARADQIRASGTSVTVPLMNVSYRTWYQADATFDCTAKTVATTANPVRLRWNDKENGSILATTLSFAQWPQLAGIGTRLCASPSAQALAGYRQHAGDPKKAAWVAIDAAIAQYPARIAQELALEASNLTLQLGETRLRVATATVRACTFELTSVEGRKARLDARTADARPRRRMIDFTGQGSAQLSGFSQPTIDRLALLMREAFSGC